MVLKKMDETKACWFPQVPVGTNVVCPTGVGTNLVERTIKHLDKNANSKSYMGRNNVGSHIR